MFRTSCLKNTPHNKKTKIKHYTIPIFIPLVACPHQCVFCDQRSITGEERVPKPSEIAATVRQYLATIAPENSIDIGFFGGSFTGMNIALQEQYLNEAFVFVESGEVDSIRLSTRPDYINPEILNLLKKYKVKTIELGAQSMDNEVLNNSGRGHSQQDIVIASQMIKDAGFSLGLQMMIGLPGDNIEKSINTAEAIVNLGADSTRIYPALVIKGTEMEALFLNNKYTPLSLEEAVVWTKKLVPIFDDGGVEIIRMGLHPSENIVSGNSLIAGPFHVSFRELVMSRIWKDILAGIKTEKSSKIQICIPQNQYNFAIGYKAENRKMLENNFKEVVFVRDSKLQNREYYVDYY